MSQSVGDRLGPFEILASLGAGGMGEVYRARDTRLDRLVAIKVSKEQFSERFEREVRAIAALNHAHICTLYDVGPNYLVMELIQGETLTAVLHKGPLPLTQVVTYGAQIADALAAAHERGITHRDLKPGNIMVTKTGVKILDFGLAKIVLPEETTVTVTQAVMGTPAYMAPEQRAGRTCDGRTDLFALGLVLYEMAAGERAAQDRALPADRFPAQFSHVVERCLAEDPAERWQAASDVRRELEWAERSFRAVAASRRPMPRVWMAAAVLVAGALGLGWAIELARRPGTEGRPVRLAVNPPLGVELRESSALSPNGRLLVFAAESGGKAALWLRPLDSGSAREMPGTEGGVYPFWSPDSRSIAFFAAGKLKRVDIQGGSPTVICDVGQGRGGSWNAEGVILFNSVNDGPLLRVSATGGQPVPATMLDTAHQENSHRWPAFLPDGHRFLYYVRSGNNSTGPGARGVYLGSLDDPREKTLLIRPETHALYAPGANLQAGYLLWVQESNLMAQPFDAAHGRLSGEAVLVAEQISVNTPARLAEFSVARDGTLAYRGASTRQYQLTWVGRDGKTLETIGQPDTYESVRISPDGSRIAVARAAAPSGGEVTIALMETARGVATPLMQAFGGVWSPDGQRLAYTWSASGSPNLYVRGANGAGEPERLTRSQGSEMVDDWSADGRYLLYNESPNDAAAPAGSDLWILPMTGDRKPYTFLKTPFRENRGQFSPDGRWIAYVSDEGGHSEIYVQSFPAGRGKWQVSNKGGEYPQWRRDGKELFYVAADGVLTSVTVRSQGNSPEFGSPVSMFRITIPSTDLWKHPFDLAPDGRILTLTPAGQAGDSSLMVLLDWQSGLGH